MKRLFIGIPIESDKARLQVQAWQTEPRLHLNRLVWTKPQNWHITLVFLGAVPEQAVAQLSRIVDHAFDNCLSYSSNLIGVGVFPEKRKPNVLWLGLDNIQPLLPGYQKLTTVLLQNNFTFDPKPFKAHLTIARVKSLNNPADFHLLLQNHHDTSFGPVSISRITLYESISSAGGVTYLPLYEKHLKR
jgi:2'-5' RNA ligase